MQSSTQWTISIRNAYCTRNLRELNGDSVHLSNEKTTFEFVTGIEYNFSERLIDFIPGETTIS